MPTYLGDLHFAWRAVIRKPVLSFVAVVTLALGIGLTSAVFALVHGVLLTPPPYPHAERIVCVSCAKSGQSEDGQCPAAGWVAWRNEARSFEAMAAYWWTFNYLVRQDGSQFIEGLAVTPDYFELIGIKPLLGRTFRQSEVSAKPDAVIVIGYDLWQKAFRGDPQILGQAIHISRRQEPLTIIGVMPSGLRFLPSVNDTSEPNYDLNARVDYWVPASVDESNLKNEKCDVAGRMRLGVTPSQAQGELAAIANRVARDQGVAEAMAVKTQALTSLLNRDGRRLLLPLLGAVALLFLIACGNVAGLLLARGLQQQREYAVRRALGAGTAQIFPLAMTEPLLISLFAGVLGVGLAMAIVKTFKAISGAAIPRLDAVKVGWPVLASCAGLAVVAAAFAGLLPALRACRVDPVSVINSGGRTGSAGRGERRLLAGAAVLQILLTVVLLVGAALLVATVGNLAGVKPCFETKNILTMSVTTMVQMDDYIDFHVRALQRVSALPGVARAAFAWGVPLTGNKWTGPITVQGQPDADKFGDNKIVSERAVTPAYFDALRMQLTAGRDFRPSDNWDNWNQTNKNIAAPGDTPFVAIINETMARQWFGGADCIGKKLQCNFWSKRTAEIIGIVKDTRTESLTQKAGPEAYFSYWQLPAFTKHLVVKSASDSRSLVTAVQKELRAIDPTVAIDHIKTLEQIRDDSIAPQKFAMRVLSGFALAGTVLALVGIYGVLSLSVHSRSREIAIRMAVGAQRRHILGLVLGEGLKLVGLGLLAGIGGAVVLARVLRAFLFGVGPADPLTFGAVAVLFTTIAMLACCLPARRATRTDPVEALSCK
jgi:putative ABC transport system permease protein